MVLMRRHGPDGFGFFTNLESRKGQEIAANPWGALCIHWKSLRKQVRAEGGWCRSATRTPTIISPAARATARSGTPATSRARSTAATPSSAGSSRVQARFAEGDVPRPPHWSGFRLVPDRIEFWEDVEHRLHHRRLFERTADGSWTEGLLYP
jgi:pyridoxamine 5'-phosphate oxidase